MAIKGGLLLPKLCEVGKIKIGGKGEKRISKSGKEWYVPEKYDHFVITKTEKGQDEKFIPDDVIMTKIGDHCTELDVMLLFDDIELNFPYWLAYYEGKACKCSGDGEKAKQRQFDSEGNVSGFQEVACPCDLLKEEKCKPHGVLSVVLKEMNSLGGVYKFRTGSWNSIQNLLGSMQMIRFMTGGILAGIPLKLVVRPQQVQPEGGKRTQVVYTVNLEYRGALDSQLSVSEQLVDKAILISERRRMSQLPIQMLISQRRMELAHIEEEEVTDIADEYYPENQRTVAEAEEPTKESATIVVEQPREPIDDEIDKGFDILGYPEGKRKAMRNAYPDNKKGLLAQLNAEVDKRQGGK